MDPHGVSGPPMGSTQARLNLLGPKPHGKYLDYDVSNDPSQYDGARGHPFEAHLLSGVLGNFDQYCWSTRKALFSSEFVERDAFQPFRSTMGVGRSFARFDGPCDKAVNNPTI
jgi:hypothetical protein